ncbi:MAG: DUF4340 domain-containing protein [Flavobacteriales bacterium]|nr:DUF4340 domain-containing protein [Flavobacteriales bacterium]
MDIKAIFLRIRQRWWLALLIIIGVGVGVVLSLRNSGEELSDRSDFALPDTGDVTRVLIYDKSGRRVELTRLAGLDWQVDGQYLARRDMIENLLNVAARMTVMAPVALAARDNIMKKLASMAVKVEYYAGENKLKGYYIGFGTQDNFGTYAILEKSTAPYIVYLPGHRGYLSEFFSPIALNWRDKRIYTYNIPDIRRVEMRFFRMPIPSYAVECEEGRTFRLLSLPDNNLLPFDTARMKTWLREFRNIAFEDFITLPKAKMDSLRQWHHLFTVSVTDARGNTKSVSGYRIPLPPNTEDAFGRIVKYDYDRMYGEISGIEGPVILQYLTFDRITKHPLWFVGKAPPENGVSPGTVP